MKIFNQKAFTLNIILSALWLIYSDVSRAYNSDMWILKVVIILISYVFMRYIAENAEFVSNKDMEESIKIEVNGKEYSISGLNESNPLIYKTNGTERVIHLQDINNENTVGVSIDKLSQDKDSLLVVFKPKE